MSDKIVFISGGSRGIGRATALRFARAEYKIIITYVSGKEEAESVARECEELGSPETIVLHLDLTQDESIIEVAKATKEKFGQIDVLINNAGVMHKGPLGTQSFSEIHDQIAVNLEGLIKLTRELLSIAKETIINIASGVGYVGKKDVAVYTATKWAVRGFTKSLAKEVPALRVYIVNPGHTATRMGSFGGTPPEKVAEVIFNAATGKYRVDSGSDIDVKYYALGSGSKVVYILKSFIKKFLGR